MKKLYTLLLITSSCISVNAQVVISQIYGGGGNTGAVYTNDFIELYNNGSTPQDLTGWSVQYASATGSTWAVTPLTSVTLQPNQYYLIQQAAGTNTIAALPTPDATGTIAMSGSTGKVILANVITAQSGTNPTGSQIIDKVGFGTTPNGFEGSGPTGTALTNSTSAFRKNSGCIDTNDNANDFQVSTPVARNTASPLGTCTPLSIKSNSISGLTMYPNPLKGNTLFITSTVNAEMNVKIYNVLGKEVLSTKVNNTSVDVSNLASGVYMVKITEEGKTATRKLVIQ